MFQIMSGVPILQLVSFHIFELNLLFNSVLSTYLIIDEIVHVLKKKEDYLAFYSILD